MNLLSARRNDDGIALIGLAGRFPGADDASAFWKMLAAGISGVTDVNASRDAHRRLPGRPNYVAKAASKRSPPTAEPPVHLS